MLANVLIFLSGALAGSFFGALGIVIVISGSRTEECARCWSRTMRSIQPKDYEE